MSDKEFILAEWLRLAQGDLRAAKLLHQGGELLLSAFHLQQCSEKLLKMKFIEFTEDQPPYIHNLSELANRAGLLDSIDENTKDLLDELTPFYIKCRYPVYKKTLSNQLSEHKFATLISRTEDLFICLEQIKK